MYFNLLFLILLPRVQATSPELFPYRGIYLYPYAAVKLEKYLAYIKESEINAVVIDFKDASGYVTYNTNLPSVKEAGAEHSLLNVENIVTQCKSAGLRLIARVVLFEDSVFAWYKGGKYSLKGEDGRIWSDGQGMYWTNPCNREVWKYNIDIAKELVSRGVTEIQFDYIRFPSSYGDYRPYRLEGQKETTIENFLKTAYTTLHPLGANIGAAVFGFSLWQPLKCEGQNLDLMAKWLDVIYPMLYPSHFAAAPEYTRERDYSLIFNSLAKGDMVIPESKFVPYIQGFKMRSPGFGPDYVANQAEAVQNSKAWGYIIWNPRSKYETVLDLDGGEGKNE
ncbi:MAG: putative glycoside hydrolase [bacterium]